MSLDEVKALLGGDIEIVEGVEGQTAGSSQSEIWNVFLLLMLAFLLGESAILLQETTTQKSRTKIAVAEMKGEAETK